MIYLYVLPVLIHQAKHTLSLGIVLLSGALEQAESFRVIARFTFAVVVTQTLGGHGISIEWGSGRFWRRFHSRAIE